MTWEFDGYRIFWDDRGDAVETICELCYFDISLDDLSMAHAVYPTENMEVDSPLHCDNCERPLVHNLTDDGIGYVIKAMSEMIYNPDGSKRRLMLKDYRKRDSRQRLDLDYPQYFDGSPQYELVQHWNELLVYYQLSDEDYDVGIEFVDRIMELEGSFRYRFYLAQEAVADRVTRPFTRFMNHLYRKVLWDIEEFQG